MYDIICENVVSLSLSLCFFNVCVYKHICVYIYWHVLEHLSFLSRTKHVHFFGTLSFLSTQVDRGRSSFQCWTHLFLLRLKVHEIWSTGQKGFHYIFNRTKDVELKQAGERQEGCLVVAHKYTYKDRRFVLKIFGRWVICKVDRIQLDPCHPDAGERQFFFGWKDPSPCPWPWCSLDVVCPRDGETQRDDCACGICYTGLARWDCLNSFSISLYLVPSDSMI